MFCNIYYGNIESFLLNDVFEKESSHVIKGHTSDNCNTLFVQSGGDLHLLMRMTDDFLLISTNKCTSLRFLNKLNNIPKKLGAKINRDKSRVNWKHCSLNFSGTGGVKTIQTCEDFLFPWCGLLIDTRTCEIRLDHLRFAGRQVTDTVLVHRSGNEGWHLKKQMKGFIRPRCCQRLLFSSCINRLRTVRLNFYQTFILCAIKTAHCLLRSGGKNPWIHERFLYAAACDTINFGFLLISSKIKHGKMPTALSPSRNSKPFRLAWKDALWLGKHAFLSVFRRVKVLCVPQQQYHHSKLCRMFSEPLRAANRKDLLAVSRQALKSFPI